MITTITERRVVEARRHRFAEDPQRPLALGLDRLGGEGIVDDDPVAAACGQRGEWHALARAGRRIGERDLARAGQRAVRPERSGPRARHSVAHAPRVAQPGEPAQAWVSARSRWRTTRRKRLIWLRRCGRRWLPWTPSSRSTSGRQTLAPKTSNPPEGGFGQASENKELSGSEGGI